MAIQLSSLNTITLDNTLVTGQIVDATEHNVHRALVENPINNYLAALRDAENNFVGSVAPADQPAGKFWFDSTNLLWKGFEVQNSTQRTLLTTDFKGVGALAAPAAGRANISPVATDAFSVAKSAWNLQGEAGTIWQLGGGAARTVAAVGVDLASYVSGTGTAGTDNTAQTVKSITLKANSLNAVGRGIRFSAFLFGSSASVISSNFAFAGTALQGMSGINSTIPCTFVGEFWYIDSTHVNMYYKIFVQGSTPLSTATANQSVATLTADQTIGFTQTQVASAHLIVYSIIIEQLG